MLEWLKVFLNKTDTPAGKVIPLVGDIKYLKGKKVLLRASLNVPVGDGVVSESFRLEQALPTINFLKERGAKVIIVGHIGREASESLKPVYEVLSKLTPLKWGGVFSKAVEELNELKNGEAILLENIRQDSRETSGEDSLAKELAALAEIYVNDAFSDSHRDHASITGVPNYLPSYFGLSFWREYKALSEAMKPKSPSVLVLGGAKFDTKLPLVLRYASIYDQIVIGGALANDIFRAKGYEVGESLVSEVDLSGSAILTNPTITVPLDVVVDGPSGKREVGPRAVRSDESIMDVGPTTLKEMEEIIQGAKTVLWNGPLGNFEKGFSLGTEMLARTIAKAEAHSVVGGGDTIAAIRSLNLSEHFDFMSTAGGAMLVFLETGTLPAITAVTKKD